MTNKEQETARPAASPSAASPASLAAIAAESAALAPQGKLSAERASEAQAIGRGLVEGLVEQATQAARRAIAPDTSAAWAGILESLSEAGLSPVMSCAKTGREIYTLTAAHFPAHLAELSRLGDTPQADSVQGQIIRAIETQKAYAALPSAVASGAGYMAFLRDAAPLDYALVALQDTFPAPAKAQSPELAQRAEQVRIARAALQELEPAALAYLCECLHLLLANIKPSAKAAQGADNTLSFYAGQPLSFPVQSPSHVAHFCKRILQLAFNLIARHRPRKLSSLTTQDILHLRVHYQGLPAYKQQQSERRKLGLAKTLQAKIKARAAQTKEARAMATLERLAEQELDANLASVSPDTMESAVLDMVAAFSTGLGRDLPVGAETQEQAAKYREIHAIATETETETMTSLFGGELSAEDMASLQELMPCVDDESDLIELGFAQEGDLELFMQAQDGGPQDGGPQEPQDAPPLALNTGLDFATPTSLAMQDAKPAPVMLAPRSPRSPRAPLKPSPKPQAPAPAPLAPAPAPALAPKKPAFATFAIASTAARK